MKICVVAHTFPRFRGDTTAAFMDPLVSGIIKSGNDVTVILPYHPELKPNQFPYRIIMYRYIWPMRLHRLGYSQTLQAGTSMKLETYILSPFMYISAIIALFRLVRHEHFDVISAHWILPNGFIAKVVSMFVSVPYTIALPGSDVYVANKNALFSWMARFAAGGTKIITADSPLYISELKRTGAKIQETRIIPYPVNTNILKRSTKGVQELRKKHHITKNTIVLLAVGRLVYKKGFQVLLSALPSVHKQKPSVRLFIAGSGDMKKQLEEQVINLSIKPYVTFLGDVSRANIGAVYNFADIFIMPSVRDHHGNIDDRPVALLEAMACGKAVIATNFAGNALTIQNGKSGLLVPEQNIQALKGAVVRLCLYKKLREKLGKNASKTVVHNFNHETIGRKYAEVFDSLIRA